MTANISVDVAGIMQFNLFKLNLTRATKRYTQKGVAHFMGCKQNHVSKIESGKLPLQKPDSENVCKDFWTRTEKISQLAGFSPKRTTRLGGMQVEKNLAPTLQDHFSKTWCQAARLDFP
jgi:transcriptional regulator with XRE-family HTH domain